MAIRDLIPWTRGREVSVRRGEEINPFLTLHREMNRLFDDVFRGFEAPSLWNRQWPTLEVEETDHGYRITVDLPGLDEKDVEVSFSDGVLSIRGEKRSEAEDRNRRVSERYYGRFERQIALGDVDDTKATARFDKGVLTIELPRSAEAQDRVRRIPINGNTRH